MKVYISGPIRGTTDYAERFKAVEEKLRFIGDTPFNPAAQLYGDGWSLSDIMQINLSALSCCDFIVRLEGWEDSVGAKLENEFALSVGKMAFDEADVNRLVEKKKERMGKF